LLFANQATLLDQTHFPTQRFNWSNLIPILLMKLVRFRSKYPAQNPSNCEVIWQATSRRKLSAPGVVEQMRQFRRPLDQCSLYGAWKASRCNLKGPKFRNFSALRVDGCQLRSLCIGILACHDETIRAITVIRLNLNLLSKILDPPLLPHSLR